MEISKNNTRPVEMKKNNEPTDAEILDVVKKVLKINDETELHEFIESGGFFQNYCKWNVIGGQPDNFKFLSNQQSDCLRALCEPIVNSMDQLLILECLKRKINPWDIKNPNLPKSMHQAAEKFYGIRKGHLMYADRDRILNLATKIKLTVLDAKNNQDQIIFIYDEATGQKPKDFKNTFLYHKPSEKNSIPFVQGQYGMGNGGVFSFSGNHKYVMILSKRHPDLVSINKSNEWGFTIIRKNLSENYHKSRYFEFLCEKNNQILSFNKDEIPNALPAIITTTDYYKNVRLIRPMKQGTLIKYFNYHNRTEKSARQILRKLNLYLWDLPLPLSLYIDRKKSKDTHREIYRGGRTLFNHSTLINPKFREGIKFNFSNIHYIDKKNIEIKFKGQAYLFQQYRLIKRGDDKGINKSTLSDLTTEFGNIKGVLTVNGQTHGTLDGNFFQNFKLKSLKKYLFVSVDFTNIIRKHSLIEDEFFMPNREKIKNSPYIKDFKEELRKTLETHPILKGANTDYREEADKQILSSSNVQLDFLEIIKKERPEILDLFNGQILEKLRIHRPIVKSEELNIESFDVIDDETILELMEENGHQDKEIRGLSFKKTQEKQIIRNVRIGQERIFIHCLSEYPIEDVKVIQETGKKWRKTPSKTLTKSNLQITLFPSGDEEINDKIKVIIRKKLHESKAKNSENHVKITHLKQKTKQPSIDEYISGKYQHSITKITKKSSLRVLNGDFIQQHKSGSLNMNDKLIVNLVFKDLRRQKIRKKKEEPLPDYKLPELHAIGSESEYWNSHELDNTFIARSNDNEDKIIISIENEDFLRKYNSINESVKEKFKNDYLKHIYLTILYFMVSLKAGKIDINFVENPKINLMLKSSQQAWLHAWKR